MRKRIFKLGGNLHRLGPKRASLHFQGWAKEATSSVGRAGTAHPLQGVRKRLPGMNIGVNARGFRWQELSTPLRERRGGKIANPFVK